MQPSYTTQRSLGIVRNQGHTAAAALSLCSCTRGQGETGIVSAVQVELSLRKLFSNLITCSVPVWPYTDIFHS